MAVETIVYDADGSDLNIGYTPLIPTGLEYLNFFGGASPVGRNLAPGKPQATVVGSPVVGTLKDGVQFTPQVAYVQTAVAHAAKMTLFLVACADADGEFLGVSNYSSVDVCTSLLLRTGTGGDGVVRPNVISAYAPSGGGAKVPLSVASGNIGVGAYQFFIATVDNTPGGVITLENKTTGETVVSMAYPAGSAAALGAALRIGSGTSALSASVSGHACWASIYSRLVGASEGADLYAQIKEFYATKARTI